ncbi:hypothetical protein NZD89_29005 (plasmid) [Alicyclobacillus fastidiosus]|uniref:Uncharacterized protein n=1 Tax=Alicyclobacillus fastidiosus TaxID=392011 RepID=A0ABY6ZQD2_9BACL|nr:hypothetical protein [Alicyclobacillus fastidiosus]WAH45024.1 hypothetical protein NZD89_29005 [Alicyclobacillus fastidiosus]GMA66231.1 hypothetical protein GCM10025859_66730 [Alicyclobacillus fastidiosus]
MLFHENLKQLIGKTTQVSSLLETTIGVLISVDHEKLTVCTSGVPGYENSSYKIFQIEQISYVRVV